MPGSTRPTKARLKLLDDGTELECYFNPTEYEMNRKVDWQQRQTHESTPKQFFAGVETTTLGLTLLFDTSLEKSNKDVRKRYTDKIWKAVRVRNPNSTQREPPPKVLFTWGTTWSFEAVIKSVRQKFLLFLEDGTPIRSEVSLTLEQVKDYGPDDHAGQNPTSRSTPGQVHVVREGDRMDLLAQQYYKKPMLWRYIAEHNDVDNPRELRAGQRLIIPPLP